MPGAEKARLSGIRPVATRGASPHKNGAFRLRYALLLGKFLVFHPMRLRSCIAEALLAIGFVLGVVAFEEYDAAVILIGEDVRGDTVERRVSHAHVVCDHEGVAGAVVINGAVGPSKHGKVTLKASVYAFDTTLTTSAKASLNPPTC